ncbi:MAG: SIS domain-containing protein [Simkaniaceae bacterium]|nr:SIS domain-containing protein [Simkaniaceae bacterium]
MKAAITESIDQAIKAIEFLKTSESLNFLVQMAEELVACLQRGGKVIVAGNGGSLCDAMHFAEELTGFFRKKRQPLAALALSDVSHMSCVANDVGFEHVFARSVAALGKKEDLLVVLTTSGNSTNLVWAVEVAKELGMRTVGFLGKTGGTLKGMCDLEWVVGGFPYSDRIQEAHMCAIHIIIEMMEKEMEKHLCQNPLNELLSVASSAKLP